MTFKAGQHKRETTAIEKKNQAKSDKKQNKYFAACQYQNFKTFQH